MNYAFASAYSNPTGSPIRELFPYLSRPGMISLAGGYPSPSLFDFKGLRSAMIEAMSGAESALQYGPTDGQPAMRDALAAICNKRGVACGSSDVLVTTGSQQAFDLLVRVMVEPGDVVLVESPCYPAAIQTLRLVGAKIREVPVDADGIRTDDLRAIVESASEHSPIKLLYIVPTFSNPSGTLLSSGRREALIRLALVHKFMVVEDDPYGELGFDEFKPKSVYAAGKRHAGERNPVVYLSSLSKTVAPALRIGWMVARQEVLRRCVIAKQTVDLCTSPLNQLVAATYLKDGRYLPGVENARRVYGARMEAMTRALREKLPRLTFTVPRGGMFLWAEWQGSPAPKPLFDAAVSAGVLFVPGAAFYAEGRDRYAMRLSYAAPDANEIVEGVERLKGAFEGAARG